MRLRRVSVYKMTSMKPELVIIAPVSYISLRRLSKELGSEILYIPELQKNVIDGRLPLSMAIRPAAKGRERRI